MAYITLLYNKLCKQISNQWVSSGCYFQCWSQNVIILDAQKVLFLFCFISLCWMSGSLLWGIRWIICTRFFYILKLKVKTPHLCFGSDCKQLGAFFEWKIENVLVNNVCISVSVGNMIKIKITRKQISCQILPQLHKMSAI